MAEETGLYAQCNASCPCGYWKSPLQRDLWWYTHGTQVSSQSVAVLRVSFQCFISDLLAITLTILFFSNPLSSIQTVNKFSWIYVKLYLKQFLSLKLSRKPNLLLEFLPTGKIYLPCCLSRLLLVWDVSQCLFSCSWNQYNMQTIYKSRTCFSLLSQLSIRYHLWDCQSGLDEIDNITGVDMM